MFLTKEAIKNAIDRGDISISDFKEEYLKSASYTFTLASKDGKDTHELEPGKFILLETKEKITLNGTYCGLLITPAHLARQGIDVTQGSNFAEPDTDNRMILEISNNGNEKVVFETGMRILKIALMKL